MEPPPKQLVSGTVGKTSLIKKYLKEASYREMIFAIWKRNGVKSRLWKRFQIKIDFIVKIYYNNITSIDISKKIMDFSMFDVNAYHNISLQK